MGLIVSLVIAAAIYYYLWKQNITGAKRQEMYVKNRMPNDNCTEAKKHYKKGNNLWADNFHAALAEFEMALLLDPENKDYQFAVNHAKKNIEDDENE